MTRVELTDTQADALRMFVGDARCWGGLTLARGTDRNAKTINVKVANALAGHGLVEIIDGDGLIVDASPADPAPAGHTARVTDEGRAWVKFAEGVEQGTDELVRTATRGLDDEARAELQAALDADNLADDEDLEDDEPAVTVTAGRPPRLFEGLRVISDQLKVKAAAIPGRPDLRHGDEAVVVLVVEVCDVQHPGDESGVTRTVVAKPHHGYLLDAETGVDLADALARLRESRNAGSPTLIDPDDDPERDLEDIVDRLNQEEMEVRDEDGRREWEDEDDLPAADAVDDLLAGAEARRPQWRVEPGTGDNDGRWVVTHPLGDVPITDSFPTDGDAISAVEERTGPLDWERTPAGVFIGFEEVG